ncbi:unnamed protein product [Schistocephalus solidus]|uniref:Uncharacterized protein n=1 Tax=Schistocephalus solidus TaxID=70667 RepID=A0A183SKS2_SCHSO|nr:unnamed protein product [Schistocephalus solidus]
MDSAINQTEVTEERENVIRRQVSSLLMTHKPRKILPKVERDALRELKAGRDIIILPADKGRSTVDLAVKTVELLLRSKYNETENHLGHAQVLQVLKFCLRTYFTFDGPIYEQVKGTPVGSPIS